VRFNFQPVLAMPGDYLILSSTDALAKDLMDALKRAADAGPATLAGKHSLVELNGDALAALLQANREALIRQNMVEKGHTREQAESEIGMLLTIADSIAHIKLEAGDEAAKQLAIELKLDVQP
jgi:acyl-CoA reductase-like NAD-dependent aldehyde dehydrogenase